MEKFRDRRQAGQILSGYLKAYLASPDTLILALPRGGVPVAAEIAKVLQLPLDVFVVRKLGTPGSKELAMGAIATGDVVLFNTDLMRALHLSQAAVDKVVEEEKQELARREALYNPTHRVLTVENKTILLVDDGVATGFTMKAAITALRQQNPRELICVVPVAAQEAYEALVDCADAVICPLKPPHFNAVGQWYMDFPQTSDEEVCDLLRGE